MTLVVEATRYSTKEKPKVPKYQILAANIPGIFLAILGRGPRAFQIGKISDVNTKFGKFS